MRNKTMAVLLTIVAFLAIAGCKPRTPKGIISKGNMEDILHDYHLAMVMAERTADQGIDQRTYEDAVLRKYDVTKAEFDSSLAYYMRHTEELHKMYEHIADRYKDEAGALGASESEINRYDALTATGDTANIWTDKRALSLMPKMPFCEFSFSVPADTAFHVGDKFTLDFDVIFMYQDGIRSGTALMAVKFSNDSVAVSYLQLGSSNHYSLTIADDHHLGVKEVKGYFIANRSQSEATSETTLQLMFVNNIHLVRMHETKKEAADRQRRDSLQKANDRIIKPDTLVKPQLSNGKPVMKNQPAARPTLRPEKPVKRSGEPPTLLKPSTITR